LPPPLLTEKNTGISGSLASSEEEEEETDEHEAAKRKEVQEFLDSELQQLEGNAPEKEKGKGRGRGRGRGKGRGKAAEE